MSLRERLAADSAYTRAGAAVLDAPLSRPGVRPRRELAVAGVRRDADAGDDGAGSAQPTSRIFELRTYESHSDRAALNKLKMFNAGEMPIFRRTGLTPVFFGETVVGREDAEPHLHAHLHRHAGA